jgi:uncharacterized protein YyaL (SSP411 family)
MPNRLIHESSPYLLQHANNPVDWYPWGDEPFERAEREGKPVLVSIGYSACHWCHVMEHESFENEETAAYMNKHFVCIKVDREEHPDVDQIYMDAVQAISQSGGWPLNVFVRPDRHPFFGGTYYPPRTAFNRPSWPQVLQRMSDIWVNHRDEADAQAAQLIRFLEQSGQAPQKPAETISETDCRTMADNLLKMADTARGGFGGAPKFPATMALAFLLDHYQYEGDEAARDHALFSLDRMIAGGIYDQLGGGLARYSTDADWLAPHFEKMLYDNALFISVLTQAYRIDPKQRYAEVIRETISFVERELKDATGGLYSALDADSEGEEGKFYTWTFEEWNTLNPEPWMSRYFGIEKEGNWEGTNILHEAQSIDAIARETGMSPGSLQQSLSEFKRQVWAIREKRIHPHCDDKSLLSWNALMNLAWTDAGVALSEPSYILRAEEHMRWMDKTFSDQENKMQRTWKAGQARISAKLDDYAYLIRAMISLTAVNGEQYWLERAESLCETVLALFSDDDDVFFYYSSSEQKDIPVRKTDLHDGAQPSANAVMAENLQWLGMLRNRSEWVTRSEEMLLRQSASTIRYTYSFAQWAILLQRLRAEPKTVSITGAQAKQFHARMQKQVPPHTLLLEIMQENRKVPDDQQDSTIIVCGRQACLAPLSDPEQVLKLL